MTRRASSIRLSDSKVRKRISTSVRRHKDTAGDNYFIDPFLRPPMCLLLICIPGAVFMFAILKQANLRNPNRLLLLFIVLGVIGIAWLITANHERKSLQRKLRAKKLFEVSLNLRKHQASVKKSSQARLESNPKLSTVSISDNDEIVTDDELSLVDHHHHHLHNEDDLIEKTDQCSLASAAMMTTTSTVGRIQKYRFSHGDIMIGKVKRLVYCRGQNEESTGLDKQMDKSTSSCRLTV